MTALNGGHTPAMTKRMTRRRPRVTGLPSMELCKNAGHWVRQGNPGALERHGSSGVVGAGTGTGRMDHLWQAPYRVPHHAQRGQSVQMAPVRTAWDLILQCVRLCCNFRAATSGWPLASTVPGPPSCPATIRSNGASSNPSSSSSAFGGTCGMP